MRRGVAPLLAAALAVGGCGDDGGATPTQASTPAPAPAPAPPHAELSGPYYDGAVSEISERRIVLHLLPERRKNPERTFVVPDPPPPGVDLEHLRGDASSGVDVRIFYRREKGKLILRGYAHPQ